LIAAVPSLEAPARGGVRLRGLLKRDELPPGCPFAPRCDFARPPCFTDEQALEDPGDHHPVACWRWRDVAVEAIDLAARAPASGSGAATDPVAVAG
jgi:oligopeptide/dipeptide ABC transporter ATP-binding protein